MAKTRTPPGQGFVVTHDVRASDREPGFEPSPAIWNATPDGGAGWERMSGSGLAADGNHICLATGNGTNPARNPGNVAERFVMLRYTPGVVNENNGKPKLEVNDFWNAFSDSAHEDTEQNLGSAGLFLILERGNLVGGGKDGILYNVNKDNRGKECLGSPVQPSVRRNTLAQRPGMAPQDCRRRFRPMRPGRSSISIAVTPGGHLPR